MSSPIKQGNATEEASTATFKWLMQATRLTGDVSSIGAVPCGAKYPAIRTPAGVVRAVIVAERPRNKQEGSHG